MNQMTPQHKHPKGVLEDQYADKRAQKNELSFRYRVRGEAVIWALKQFRGESDGDVAILDMGAAEGKTLQYMAGRLRVSRGVGIEYNQALIDKAGPMDPQLGLVQGDVTHLAGENTESYDVVSALALLEHLPDPAQAVDEAARILKKGGIFVATSPVPFWDHVSVRLGLLKEDQHECDMHAAFFRSLLTNTSGLRLVAFKKFMWAPVGFLPYLGIIPDPVTALAWDRRIERIKVLNFLFINQLAVAIKE